MYPIGCSIFSWFLLGNNRCNKKKNKREQNQFYGRLIAAADFDVSKTTSSRVGCPLRRWATGAKPEKAEETVARPAESAGTR